MLENINLMDSNDKDMFEDIYHHLFVYSKFTPFPTCWKENKFEIYLDIILYIAVLKFTSFPTCWNHFSLIASFI